MFKPLQMCCEAEQVLRRKQFFQFLEIGLRRRNFWPDLRS